MKSAYELAMERMERDNGPARSLSDEQREQLAEIDKRFDAQIAEEKMAVDQKFASGDMEGAAELKQALSARLQSIEEKREAEKEAIWNEA